ncbi:hypothetical protein HBI29_071530 [Parastagonospora nodorum]|nr:hypothetical protein HBH75_019240 [Parastagonospora nodorum]KAH4973519.1 hypothetical protein HBI78_002950 [Parastagonospora nodorum]KAH5323313.1 hypothetical protein HBI11_041610 [Parastagonospora nodorum]KAH5519404.1 hypothetical protein HBI29_071530 [Parastagonospora nodorum]
MHAVASRFNMLMQLKNVRRSALQYVDAVKQYPPQHHPVNKSCRYRTYSDLLISSFIYIQPLHLIHVEEVSVVSSVFPNIVDICFKLTKMRKWYTRSPSKILTEMLNMVHKMPRNAGLLNGKISFSLNCSLEGCRQSR